MVVLRDDVCTTAWCDAPVVHADHTHPVRAGGRTGFFDGNGKCARCNGVKEASGWSVHAAPWLNADAGDHHAELSPVPVHVSTAARLGHRPARPVGPAAPTDS